MAEKLDKTAALVPLSVSVSVSMEEEEKEKKKQAARAALDLLPAVRDAILWTLLHAGIITVTFAFSFAYCLLITTIFSHPPSWMLPRPLEITDAEATVAVSLMAGMFWCAALQATVGVLALMLPSRRCRLRLLLAYAALVATAASHCMLAGLQRMMLVAAEPEGRLSFRTVNTAATIFIIGVGDLLCFLGLALRGGEE